MNTTDLIALESDHEVILKLIAETERHDGLPVALIAEDGEVKVGVMNFICAAMEKFLTRIPDKGLRRGQPTGNAPHPQIRQGLKYEDALDSGDWLIAPYVEHPKLAPYRETWLRAKSALDTISQKNDPSTMGELEWQRAFKACMSALSAYIAAEGDLYDMYTYQLEGDYVDQNA